MAAAKWRLKTTFWLDIGLLVSVCALQTVRFTGLVVHEWLGLAVIVMVLAHLLFSWSWIVTQSRRLLALQTYRERVNYFLNLALFFTVTGALFSGVLISQKAIPVLIHSKISPDDMDLRWAALHQEFAALLLLFSALHLAINWEWILAATGTLFRRFRESVL